MKQWSFDGIKVDLRLGPHNGEGIELVVKTRGMKFEVGPAGTKGSFGNTSGVTIRIDEATVANKVQYWPPVSVRDTDRRKTIYRAATEALRDAEKEEAKTVGFYTMGLEIAGIPSWEVAEEIVRALQAHPKAQTKISSIVIVASSPTQLTSLEYALNNAPLFYSR